MLSFIVSQMKGMNFDVFVAFLVVAAGRQQLILKGGGGAVMEFSTKDFSPPKSLCFTYVY